MQNLNYLQQTPSEIINFRGGCRQQLLDACHRQAGTPNLVTPGFAVFVLTSMSASEKALSCDAVRLAGPFSLPPALRIFLAVCAPAGGRRCCPPCTPCRPGSAPVRSGPGTWRPSRNPGSRPRRRGAAGSPGQSPRCPPPLENTSVCAPSRSKRWEVSQRIRHSRANCLAIFRVSSTTGQPSASIKTRKFQYHLPTSLGG